MRIVKILAVLVLGIAILASALNYYFAKAASITAVSGYLILLDQKISESDYLYLGEKELSTIIYLPSTNADGMITYCVFTFPEGVDEKADITKDGRIDYADAYLLSQAYGCQKHQACWNESFKLEQCYFVYSGRRFQDPSRDCYINETDLNIVKKYYGKTTEPYSANCELDEACMADVNKDGVINLFDVVILAANFNKYANEFVNYAYIKKSACDLNNDGNINLFDAVILGRNFGQMANEQKCYTKSLTNLGNYKYQVSVKGKGLHYVGVSYRILMV